MYEVTNPLDVMDSLVYESLIATYMFIVEEHCYNPSVIPTIEMIHNHFVHHFIQELVVDVFEKQNYETLGAENMEDFLSKVKSRKYHPYIPDLMELRDSLDMYHLTYLENNEIHNPVVTEVW